MWGSEARPQDPRATAHRIRLAGLLLLGLLSMLPPGLSCGGHGPLYDILAAAIEGEPSEPAPTYLTDVQVGDVTGDGVLDVIACFRASRGTSHAICVWAGGPAPSPRPTAELPLKGTSYLYGPPLRLADVTGDGVLDVLGAVQGSDRGTGDHPIVVDVTNDGILDVVTRSGSNDGDVIEVRTGGETPDPWVILAPPGKETNVTSVTTADVTGDGTPDVIGAWEWTQPVIGLTDPSGTVCVWAGGSALAGSPQPLRTLAVDDIQPWDSYRTPLSFYVVAGHLAGSSGADVIAIAPYADIGALDAGTAYVWSGGTSQRGTTPTAILRSPTPRGSATVGLPLDYWRPWPSRGILQADVTGDGVPDVLLTSASPGRTRHRGALLLWSGAVPLSGTPPPLARLYRP